MYVFFIDLSSYGFFYLDLNDPIDIYNNLSSLSNYKNMDNCN